MENFFLLLVYKRLIQKSNTVNTKMDGYDILTS